MAPLYADENHEGPETWSGVLLALQFAAQVALLLPAPFSQQITTTG